MARVLKTILGLFAAFLVLCIAMSAVLVPLRNRHVEAEFERTQRMRARAVEDERRAMATSPSRGRASPYPRGIDVEASLDDAIRRAAEEVDQQLRRRGRRPDGGWVYIRPLSPGVEPAARDLTVELRRNHEIAATMESRNGASVVIDLDLRDDDDLGPVLALRGGVNAAIGVDERLASLLPAAEGRRYPTPHRRRALRFKTAPTLDRESALADGREFLAHRIAEDLAALAISERWIDGDEQWRFESVLEERYPADVLIGLGRARIEPEETAFDDQTFHHANVVWTADQRELDHVAQGVAKTLLIEDREPWIKLGLSVGLLVLAILGWLRIDWWLKGHYSFLTKLACAMLLVAGLGLLWSFRLNA